MSKADVTSIDPQQSIYVTSEAIVSPPTSTRTSNQPKMRKKNSPSWYLNNTTVNGVIRRKLKN